MFDTGALEQYARNLNLPRGAPWSRRISYVSGRERRAPATHPRVVARLVGASPCAGNCSSLLCTRLSILLVLLAIFKLDASFPGATYGPCLLELICQISINACIKRVSTPPSGARARTALKTRFISKNILAGTAGLESRFRLITTPSSENTTHTYICTQPSTRCRGARLLPRRAASARR